MDIFPRELYHIIIREESISEVRTAPPGKFRVVGYLGKTYECWKCGEDFDSCTEALSVSRKLGNPSHSAPFYRVHDDKGEWIRGDA